MAPSTITASFSTATAKVPEINAVPPEVDMAGKVQAFAVRVMEDTAAALGVFQLYLGSSLGVWAAMTPAGQHFSSHEVAKRAGLSERYVRELLCGCATQGYVEYFPDTMHHTSADSCHTSESHLGTFSLPAAHAFALLDSSMAAGVVLTCPTMLATCAQVIPELKEAFRTGGGIPYESYGSETVEAISRLNKHTFDNKLASQIIPAMPDVEQVLTRGGLIADVGCGVGNSSRAAARGYPKCRVIGIDTDVFSIQEAKEESAKDPSTSASITYVCGSTQSALEEAEDIRGSCDLVMMFQCLHDMHNPVQVLSDARKLAKPNTGAVLIGDEKVLDRLEDMLPPPGTPDLKVGGPETPNFLGRLDYGVSVLHCLPQAMVFPDSVGTGTCMGPKQVEKYAKDAGWGGVKIIGETDSWWLYRLEW